MQKLLLYLNIYIHPNNKSKGESDSLTEHVNFFGHGDYPNMEIQTLSFCGVIS
jgi:hypothetical protein